MLIHAKAAMVACLEVFIAADRPRGDSLVIVHDSTNVGTGFSKAVVARGSRGSIEVMLHASVVANLMGEDLENKKVFLDTLYENADSLRSFKSIVVYE